MKHIVVLGGGASGWLTALYLQMSLAKVKITVVESKSIGILGAGEGSVPPLISLLDYLKISVSEIIKECDATIKTGIKFTNWNNDNEFYHHSFSPGASLDFNGLDFNLFGLSVHSAVLSDLYRKETIKNVDFIEKCSKENKVPFIKNNYKYENPIFNYDHLAFYSIHFNAIKMANKLKEIGVSRGINLIDSVVSDIIFDNNDNVKSLVLENNKKINLDFIFDCSGFSRLIIGKKYNAKWKSHSKYLPVDSAIPFFLETDKYIPPYTEAIAMKYGWIWKIPLQSRYGCGYVYDSSLVEDDEIRKEIEDWLGYVPEYQRKDKGPFKFEAGYFEEPWINNCIAIGLAAGFIEPLEATSIWVTIMSLEKILGGVEWLFINDERHRKYFNNYFKSINDQVVDFIYFHYMSERKDTDFWKKFTYENASDNLKNKLNMFDYRLINRHDVEGEIWSTISWLSIANGNKKINKNISKIYNKHSRTQVENLNRYEEIVKLQNDIVSQCIDHKVFFYSFNDK